MFGFFKRKKHAENLVPESILDLPFLILSESDVLTIRDACQGIHIFGGIGSGKSSGSGKAIAQEFLNLGFGGLVLTVKPDELSTWQEYMRKTGREDDLVVISPENPYRFNFLDYECQRSGGGGGQTENIVSLFMSVMEVAERGGGEQDYWTRASKQLLRNAVDLCRMAQGTVNLKTITGIINSAPKSNEEARSDNFQNSQCYKLLSIVDQKQKDGLLSELEMNDYELTFEYWIKEFPTLANNTRSGIISTFTTMADVFLRGELYRLFCTETNITPEDTFDGKVIVFNFPVKQWNEVGLYSQLIFKLIWQQAIERRRVTDDTFPAFLWVDESQTFISGKDQEFMTTCRSARACVVYLSQNIPNYISALGEAARSRVDSLLGNFQTKIFHQNAEPITNRWASDLIGRAETMSMSYSGGSSQSENSETSNSGYSGTTKKDSVIDPEVFTGLRMGGSHNNFEVDGIIVSGGNIWNATGMTYIPVIFRQI